MKKILVVDDEPLLREAYGFVLEASGYTVMLAEDGEAAIQLMHEKPDLILLDLLMPNIDGVEFLKRINVKNDFPDMIVIVFSNLSISSKVDEALKLGAHKHITKSDLSPKQVVEEVNAMLGIEI
jgi:CheY-like chemotaxis protein